MQGEALMKKTLHFLLILVFCLSSLFIVSGCSQNFNQKELASYSVALSSLTGGRASFTTKFASYELVPNDIQQELIKAHEAELADKDE